jgi:hypothetical protein
MHRTQGLKLVFIKAWEAYNALGLAFYEGRRLMVRTLWQSFRVLPSFSLVLLGLHLLSPGLEFEQHDSFRETYCMHMHVISIMNA